MRESCISGSVGAPGHDGPGLPDRPSTGWRWRRGRFLQFRGESSELRRLAGPVASDDSGVLSKRMATSGQHEGRTGWCSGVVGRETRSAFSVLSGSSYGRTSRSPTDAHIVPPVHLAAELIGPAHPALKSPFRPSVRSIGRRPRPGTSDHRRGALRRRSSRRLAALAAVSEQRGSLPAANS
jgi:hypothetical protein